ncbi:hypothetical protein ACOXXX_01620 [Thalassococcus sp. BH17M4-6]|uniref:hypothetical protein n=1 Tax=Thalassococcus sp. BH17M4-6 TaxID=3413148 RepID=UPI003BC03234
MLRSALPLILATVAATAAQADIQGFATGLSRDGGDTQLWNAAAPAAGFQGEYYTTPDNCTYRRTQAPGYPAQWYLVQNPHHIGRPTAHRGCRGTL